MAKKHISSIDFLRAIAILGVVLIHTFPVTGKGNIDPSREVYIIALHSMLYWAVPVFVMITGALMLSKKEPVKKTLMRIVRLLVALFIFGWAMAFFENFFYSHDILHSALIGILSVFNGKTWDPMWYMYMIVGLYFILPLLSTFVQNSDDKTIIYMLAVLFVFNSVIPMINRAFDSTLIAFYIPVNTIYPFYALLGYYLFNRHKPQLPSIFFWMGIAASIIILILLVPGNILYRLERVDEVPIYSAPVIVLLSSCVFVLGSRFDKEISVVKFIAQNSFAIYLIHCFFLHLFSYGFKIQPENYNMLISIPMIWLAAFVLSLLSSAVVRKIPLVRKYIL